MDSETQRELGLLLRHQSAHCCTSLFDDYEIQLPLWSVSIPTCDLLSTTKPLKQVRWRKFCCKHTSTIYFDSKVRRDNQNPSAMHSVEENSHHARIKREWERVWIQSEHPDSQEPARPILSDRDNWDARGLARLRAFNMYNQSRDYPEEMISHDSFLLQDPDYQPAKPERDDYSELSAQEPSPRCSYVSQSEISSQCSDNSSVGTSEIQHLHDSSPCTEFSPRRVTDKDYSSMTEEDVASDFYSVSSFRSVESIDSSDASGSGSMYLALRWPMAAAALNRRTRRGVPIARLT